MLAQLNLAPPHIDRGPLGQLPPALEWRGGADGCLRLLDQTRLPERVHFLDCRAVEQVWEAIRVLRVRGAPAIGVAAAYGLCLGARDAVELSPDAFRRRVAEASAYLLSCRPTAVNLAWALGRLTDALAASTGATSAELWAALLRAAHALALADAETCRRIGEHGVALVPDGGGVLTHCNAGALATVAYGTALAPLYLAHAQGKRFRVYADETRPLLQGARLTAWELRQAGLDVTVLCDNAAPMLMRSGAVQLAIVGADRIAANGDTANKIGTYGVALAAQRHGVPLYVAAPRSTFDLALASGADIPIEFRPEDEVRAGFERQTAPAGVPCYNPAFDVTPAELLAGIITERGVIRPVSAAGVGNFFQNEP